MEVCYTHADVSRVSQSVTLLGGVRFMLEGKIGYSNHDFLTSPYDRLPMTATPDIALLSPFNRHIRVLLFRYLATPMRLCQKLLC